MRKMFEAEELFRTYAAPVMRIPEWEMCRHVRHHHFTNVQAHSVHVGIMSVSMALWLTKHLHQHIDIRLLCMAAAGHDLGMAYRRNMHEITLGWTHPVRSYDILKIYFGDNRKLKYIVRRHMWPLCIVPPVSKEGWILTLADKICAVEEKLGYGISGDSFVPGVR